MRAFMFSKNNVGIIINNAVAINPRIFISIIRFLNFDAAHGGAGDHGGPEDGGFRSGAAGDAAGYPQWYEGAHPAPMQQALLATVFQKRVCPAPAMSILSEVPRY